MKSITRPTVIAITGGSGSGKTSLLRTIRSKFRETEVCIISQDDYYRLRTSQPADVMGYVNFDLPSALDLDAFVQDLKAVINGERVTRERYVFNKEAEKKEIHVFLPSPVILIEGLFLDVRESFKDLIDFTIFLHAKENLKLIRRISRDIQERNYQLDEILHRYQHHVMPCYAKYISHWRENADLVINNNDSYEKGLQMFLAFLRSQVEQKSLPD